MSENVYNKICAIFNIDNESKILSYDNYLSTECFDEYMIYKTFLFEFCFLLKKGSVEFKSLNDIWFFKTFNSKEKEIALNIIDILINKAEKKKLDDEVYLNVIIGLVTLNDYEKYITFKYLQSIFSYYNKNFEYIIFPLLYSIGFNNEFIKSLLKNDLIGLMSPLIDKIDDQDRIYYYNINEEFLLYLNKLIYYIKYNESNPKEKKDITPLYQYLCENLDNSKKPKNLDNDYPESFNCFLELKALLFEYDTKYAMKKSTKKIPNESEKEKKSENDNNKGNSIKSSSDKDSNENSINANDSYNQQKVNNDTHDSIDEKIKNGIKKYFLYYSKYNTINNLCSKISSTMKEAKLNKEFVEKYYKLLRKNSENKLLINKLSSTMLMLKNSNAFNIKIKLAEVLSFCIIEKYKDFFSFSNDYYPSKTNLKELRTLILQKKKDNQEGEKDELINNDLDKINNMINDNEYKNNNESYIQVNEAEKKGKQIKMALDFLKFCQNYLNSYVHASKTSINYYLLPFNMFSSNLKYADYIFSLTDILKKNKDGEEGNKIEINIEKEKNSCDYKLYKEKKVIDINEALQILLSNKINILNEIDIDKILEKKKEFQNTVKVFHKKIEPFYQIIPEDFDQVFIAKDEIESNEADFYKKLSDFNMLISKIIEDKLSRDEAHNVIKNIKKLIEEEIKELNISYSNFEKSIIEPDIAFLDSKANRIYLILKFLREQKDKIKKADEDINETYENYLNILMRQASLYKNYLENYLQFNVNLFEEWAKEVKSKYKDKYLEYGVLLENFLDLLKSVELDINYSYDEKFILWAVKNSFANYLK